jgi:hypothetical protein
MRDWDVREIFATRDDDDPLRFAHEACSLSRFGMVAADDDGVPVAAIGAVPLHRGVFALWMVATDARLTVAPAVTR